MDIFIRPARLTDLDALRDIYNHYVRGSTCTFQIELETEQERLAWFHQGTALQPRVVAESEGDILGWAALSPWKSRCAYAGSVELSVYVRHDRHRLGVGRALLQDLIDRATAAGIHTIIGGACSEQGASLALQRAFGFEQVAHFRQVGFKFDRWLDVVYMQLILANRDATSESSE